jgi:conjugative transposon TraN protein
MKNIVIVAAAMLLVSSAKAQQTYQELEQITVNEQVTTLVTASEPILFVDVSTDKVAGDKPIENTVRFKPKDAEHTDGEVLAIATIVTERYRTQYALVYTTKMTEAVTDKEIAPYERTAYRNPAVSLSTEDMTKFARRVWNSPAKIHNVKAMSNRMLMRLNNIYAVGEYFFLDFSVDNRTNIRFDIDELRVKLVDKKVQKATNNQTIELPLALVLDHSRSFLHGYRNVIVFKKMTFPNDKVVTIELSEKQISGRAISISVDYEDVLSADAFDRVLLEEE